MKKIILFLIVVTGTVKAQSLKDAQRLNDNEQYDAATDIYKTLIVKEPANGNNYYYFGENLLDAGKQDSALLIFNKGLQAEATNPINHVGIGKVKMSLGLLTEAKAAIDAALNINKNKNALVLLEAGEAYTQFKTQDLFAAQSILETAIKLDPKNPDIYNALGDVYSELNNGTEAAKNYNKSLDLDKNYVKALLHKGQLYKRSKNYEGAAVEFQNALAIDANFAPAYRELGEVFYLQRKLDKAKENYRKYLDLSKNNNTARLRYASFLFYSKSFPEALTELNQITPVDSNNIGLMRLSAYINYESNDNMKAERFINRLFAVSTDTAKRITLDYEYYGKILIKNGNDSVGGLYLWQAYYMDPSKTDMLSDMGAMFMKGKHYHDAIKAYREKIIQGKNVTTTDYFNLGKSHYFNKEYIMADSAFMKVTELQPEYLYGFFWRGRANSNIDSTGKQGLAKPFNEKFIELATADSSGTTKYRKDLIETYHSLAAYYYIVEKKNDQALIYWRKILELDPEDKKAKDFSSKVKG